MAELKEVTTITNLSTPTKSYAGIVSSLTTSNSVAPTPLSQHTSPHLQLLYLAKKEQHRDEILIVFIQHILRTTLDMLEALLSLGLKKENFLGLGKRYSTCQQVLQEMQQKGFTVSDSSIHELAEFDTAFKKDVSEKLLAPLLQKIAQHTPSKIILLDDGAQLLIIADQFLKKNPTHPLHHIPIIGIEQTQAGEREVLASRLCFPWFSVARSKMKSKEPPFIAEAIWQRIQKVIPSGPLEERQKIKCGIIGLGYIGKALYKKLSVYGYSVHYYDVQIFSSSSSSSTSSSEFSYQNLKTLFKENDYIFGCTGFDTLQNLSDLEIANLISLMLSQKNHIYLISCSSADNEFRRLLIYLRVTTKFTVADPLNNIDVQLGQSHLHILRGGMPINFDGGPHSVDANIILLTRYALVAGIYQAMCSNPKNMEIKRFELDIAKQKFLILKWVSNNKARINQDLELKNFIYKDWAETFELDQTDIDQRLNVYTSNSDALSPPPPCNTTSHFFQQSTHNNNDDIDGVNSPSKFDKKRTEKSQPFPKIYTSNSDASCLPPPCNTTSHFFQQSAHNNNDNDNGDIDEVNSPSKFDKKRIEEDRPLPNSLKSTLPKQKKTKYQEVSMDKKKDICSSTCTNSKPTLTSNTNKDDE
jgi:hypothetical protein